MSFFRRHAQHSSSDSDTENDAANDSHIDPELRLRTVRTAASTIAESIRNEARIQRRKSKAVKRSGTFKLSLKRRQHPTSISVVSEEGKLEDSGAAPALTDQLTAKKALPMKRRNIYVNEPLPQEELDAKKEPLARYVRNKVRTTKYTIITFVPKNLFEQFRRVANLYFLFLVVLQVFPIFGAAASSISWLPLAFILTVTGLKDGVEDYRRGILDEEVNNSPATKLGGWRNVNHPLDGRNRWEKLFGLNKPGSVSKGVRKLREREMSEGKGRITIDRQKSTNSGPDESGSVSMDGPYNEDDSTRLDDIQSMASQSLGSRSELEASMHSYPPSQPSHPLKSSTTLVASSETGGKPLHVTPSATSLKYPPTTRSRADTTYSSYPESVSAKDTGIISYSHPARGTALWQRTLWKKLLVGDIILLRENEQVPADTIVLSSSDPDGLCFVETKNLDGETNLKPRRALKATVSALLSEDDVERAMFHVDSEAPHANLYLYNGVLKYRTPRGEDKREPVTINELLLRGCALRNTAWVIGLVVATGADTKIMLNGGATPSKRSKIERETNFNVVVNFVILFAMCLITAIASGLFEGKRGTSADFFEIGAEPTRNIVLNSVITFASALIAFQNIVPISLYISIEIVKTIQAYFISQDIDMFYAPFNITCIPKTWNISDDLGQIEYIFSDKTGTLTQNVMEFQKCSVNGIPYGEGVTEAQKGAALRDGKMPEDPDDQKERVAVLKRTMVEHMKKAYKNQYLNVDKLTLVSPKLAEDLANRDGEQRSHLIAFFRALALCHTVLAERPEPQEHPFNIEYKAESPDEAALVAAARDVGFPFLARSNAYLEIEVMGQKESHIPLKVLEFNSTRKRMSVIVRNPEGRIVLYTKGADSVIYERLTPDHDPALKDATTRDMEMFANNGLRTLCVAFRYLDEREYFDWAMEHDEAASAIQDRDEKIDAANEKIEHSLTILGATALEDKLQQGVPDAIEQLHKAGIKLWILTGDKVQTAIEIGYSCNLLKHEMDIMILQAESIDRTRALIEAGLNKMMSVTGPPSLDRRKRGFVSGKDRGFAVVIDGETLRYALDPSLKPLFLNLGSQCEAVVCCRVSPAQKALTVKLVKEGLNAMTLAIGDGANDVAMIQEANIGCGLFGLEGSQAAMSADYAFGQFRFLTKLLLVHGRWSYQRIADMHGNFFYKNVIWTFAMFWFLFFNSFDATYLYEYSFILLYNLVFTSLPVIILGAFDQDVNAKASLAFPQLYIPGIRGLEYTKYKFWGYMLDGFYQSTVVFFVPYLAWQVGGVAASWTGRTVESLADFGTTASVAAILCANQYVGINTRYWTVITWIVVYGSTFVMLLWIAVYSSFTTVDFDDEVTILFGSINFWATLILSLVLAIGPRFFLKFLSQAYWPQDRDIVREMWVQGDLKDQLGIQHRKQRKNRLVSKPKSTLEAVSMYQSPHARSASELSAFGVVDDMRGVYMAAGTDTPTAGTPHKRTYQDTSPPPSHAPSAEPGNVLRAPSQSRSPLHSPSLSYYSAADISNISPTHPDQYSPQDTSSLHSHPLTPATIPSQSDLPPPTSTNFRIADPGLRWESPVQHIEMSDIRPSSPRNALSSRLSEISNYATAENGEESDDDSHTTIHQRTSTAHDPARPSIDSSYSDGPRAF